MQIDYISDLHITHYTQSKKGIQTFIDRLIPKDNADILIIAGDISEYANDIIHTLEAFSKYYPKIFFVFGNHDLYLTTTKQIKKYNANSNTKVEEIKQHFENHPHIEILDNTLTTYQELTIAGSKNWYTLKNPQDEFFWRYHMADSTYIYPKTFEASEALHQEDNAFLTQLPTNLDILITHVPPIHMPNSTHKPNGCFYHGSPTFPEPKLWVAGHQHTSGSTQLGSTMLYLNPYGYPKEITNPGIKTINYHPKS